ncbi:MAG TPA: hypothetical protein VGM93_03010, partial [Acidimicrobiales bacterium]
MTDPTTNDDLPEAPGELGIRLESIATTVHAAGDVADVRRRLRHQRQARTSLAGVAAAVAVIATVAAWPSHDSQRLDLAGAPPTSGATATAGPSAASVAVASGGFRQLSSRTTADGVTLAYGNLTPDTPYWTAPAACQGAKEVLAAVGKTGANVSESIGTNGSTPPDPATTVEVTPSYIPVATVPDGAPGTTTETQVGTATAVTPVTPTSIEQTPIGLVTVVGSSIKSASATFSNGSTDAAEASAGAVVLGTRYAKTTNPTPLGGPVVTSLTVTLSNDALRSLPLDERVSGNPVVHVTNLVPSPGNVYDLSGTLLVDGTKGADSPDMSTGIVPVTPECTAPPAPLPAAGHQPADPTAAKAGVTAALQGFFGTRDQATQAADVSDPSFGQAVLTELSASVYAAAAASA